MKKKPVVNIAIVAVVALLIGFYSMPALLNSSQTNIDFSALDSLQNFFKNIGSSIDVRADRENQAVFENHGEKTIVTYAGSINWSAAENPFEFGIYEFGNPGNKIVLFSDSSDNTGEGATDPGDYADLNFNSVLNVINSVHHDRGNEGPNVSDSTSDWIDWFGFFFSWGEGEYTYYSEDNLNGPTGPSFLAFRGRGDNVSIGGQQPANDSGSLYVAMEGWGNSGENPDFSDIVVQVTPAAPVPEPATLFLFGSGLFVLAIFRKKRAQ